MPPAQVLAVRGEALTLDRGRIVALAEAERQWARPDRSPADFIPAPGTRVRFRVGPFEGMRAEVVKATAWEATVDLGIGPVTTPTDALEAA
jgi:transcription antitermination factor NusG